MGGFFGGGATSMVGATASVAGSGGSVPAPAAGNEYAYLRGDATFKNPLIQSSFINTTQEGYATAPFGLGMQGSAVPTDNTLYLVPNIVIPATYTKIMIRRGSGTAGASMKVRMGIYECDFDKLCPTTLILETADTSLASSTSDVTVTISQSLTKGLYFLACVFTGSSGWNASATIRTSLQSPFWGTVTGASDYRTNGGFAYTHNYAALPSTITASSLAFNASNLAVVQLVK